MGTVNSISADSPSFEAESSELLLLPEILSKVLSFLCLEDLKSCRQVNSFWENIANEILRQRVQVVFRQRVEIQSFLKLQQKYLQDTSAQSQHNNSHHHNHHHNHHNNTTHNNSFPHPRRTLPFHSFDLKLHDDFELNNHMNINKGGSRDKLPLHFMGKCGRIVKELKLSGHIQDRRIKLAEFLTLISETCPNLVSLEYHVSLFNLDYSSTATNCGAFFNLTSFTYSSNFYASFVPKHLLNRMPSLKQFKYICESGTERYGEPTLVQIISNAYDNGNLRCLNTLEFFTSKNPSIRNDTDLMLLITMSLKLVKFSAVIDHRVNLKLLYQLLESMKDTLRILNIAIDFEQVTGGGGLDNNYYTFEFPFPCLQFLSSLTISSSIISNHLFDKIPNLTSLIIRGTDTQILNLEGDDDIDDDDIPGDINSQAIQNQDQVHSAPENREDLRKCRFLSSICFRNPNLILSKAILHKFSSLRLHRLEIPGDDEVLLEIYQTFPGLEELVIYTSEHLTTRGFTGLSLAELSARSLWPVPSTFSKKDIHLTLSQMPFIGCLTNLRLLEIRQQDTHITDSLSDCAVILGICSVRTIATLKLDVHLSRKAVQALSQLLYLQTMYVTPRSLSPYEESGDIPTTAEWFQNLMNLNTTLEIYVKVQPTEYKKAQGYDKAFEIRRLKVTDKYVGEDNPYLKYVYLDEIRSGLHGSVYCGLVRRKCCQYASNVGNATIVSAQWCLISCYFPILKVGRVMGHLCGFWR